MKRINLLCSIFILMLLTGIFPSLAQDASANTTANITTETNSDDNTNVTIEIDQETEVEVEVMTESHGAEMRLLQLERKINRAILHMEETINFLKAKNKTVTELEPIVVEMKALLEEVKKAPTDKTEEAVKKFIEIKSDAKDLIKKFRETVKSLLSEEDKKELKSKFENIDKTKLEDIKKKIQERKRMLNAERVKKILEKMEINDEELLNQIKSGNMSSSQLKIKLVERYNGLGDSAKESIRIRIKEQYEKRIEMRIGHIIKAKEGQFERQSERLKERAKKLERAGYQKASEEVGKIAERFEYRADKIGTRATAKVDARINTEVSN
ncbi:MAG: hypothetical protein Q7S27_02745 [Nanoarchaeota archaeon]|nr:hypothetical protein [Nanoarchaeota archaeon]